MKKQILIFSILIASLTYAKLEDLHWGSIVTDIVRDSDSNSQTEYEIAKQAFLQIKSNSAASKTAKAISQKWAELGSQTSFDHLMSLKRYPTIKSEDELREETYKMFKKPNISGFIEKQGLDVVKQGNGSILKEEGSTSGSSI